MAVEVKSIAEHWDLLWIVVCTLFGAVVFLIWRTICRIEKTQEKILDCITDLMKDKVSKDEFKEWKDGRKDIWESIKDIYKALGKHRHSSDGGTIREDS